MFSKNLNVVDILQIGVIGLGFLLAVLAYHLLTKEQKQETPRNKIINSIYVFMGFSVVLCVIGIFSQVSMSDNTGSGNTAKPNNASAPDAGQSNVKTFYSYFADVGDDNKTYICSIGKFDYSERLTAANRTYIEGVITGKMKDGENLIDGQWSASGYIDNYFLRLSYETGIALLEYNKKDYTGYWIGEADDPDLKAVICPWVLSPAQEGLSAENAKSRWPILNEPCREIKSFKDFSSNALGTTGLE